MLPWIQMLVTAVISVLASSGFWAYFQSRHEDKSARTRLLVGLAHDRILQSGMYYVNRGYVTIDEYENLYEYLYKPYKELGGNGTAEKVMEELKALPHNKPEN